MAEDLAPGLLAQAELERLLAQLRTMLLTQPVAEVYIAVVVQQGAGSIAIALADSGTTRHGVHVLDTLSRYLKTKKN